MDKTRISIDHEKGRKIIEDLKNLSEGDRLQKTTETVEIGIDTQKFINEIKKNMVKIGKKHKEHLIQLKKELKEEYNCEIRTPSQDIVVIFKNNTGYSYKKDEGEICYIDGQKVQNLEQDQYSQDELEEAQLIAERYTSIFEETEQPVTKYLRERLDFGDFQWATPELAEYRSGELIINYPPLPTEKDQIDVYIKNPESVREAKRPFNKRVILPRPGLKNKYDVSVEYRKMLDEIAALNSEANMIAPLETPNENLLYNLVVVSYSFGSEIDLLLPITNYNYELEVISREEAIELKKQQMTDKEIDRLPDESEEDQGRNVYLKVQGLEDDE